MRSKASQVVPDALQHILLHRNVPRCPRVVGQERRECFRGPQHISKQLSSTLLEAHPPGHHRPDFRELVELALLFFRGGSAYMARSSRGQ